MASDGANIMHDGENTAERLPAVNAPSHQQPSISIHGYLSEKSEPGFQSIDEKVPSGSSSDMETGGVRPTGGKASFLNLFSPQNPYIWPYLALVSIEAGGLLHDYLLFKTLNKRKSERVSQSSRRKSSTRG